MAALQASDKCSHTVRMLRFLDRPALVEHHNFGKSRREIPLASGAIEPHLRF